MSRSLYRSRDRVIAGVCGGLAEYFDWNVTGVRIVWLVLALGGGIGLLAYLILALVLKSAPAGPEY